VYPGLLGIKMDFLMDIRAPLEFEVGGKGEMTLNITKADIKAKYTSHDGWTGDQHNLQPSFDLKGQAHMDAGLKVTTKVSAGIAVCVFSMLCIGFTVSTDFEYAYGFDMGVTSTKQYSNSAIETIEDKQGGFNPTCDEWGLASASTPWAEYTKYQTDMIADVSKDKAKGKPVIIVGAWMYVTYPLVKLTLSMSFGPATPNGQTNLAELFSKTLLTFKKAPDCAGGKSESDFLMACKEEEKDTWLGRKQVGRYLTKDEWTKEGGHLMLPKSHCNGAMAYRDAFAGVKVLDDRVSLKLLGSNKFSWKYGNERDKCQPGQHCADETCTKCQ
jgi:hypothetical protein